MSLVAHDVALQIVLEIRPLLERIAHRDKSLADQLRRSASSVALNIGEAAYSRGGNAPARFQDAAGSASETRAALRVASAWGYIGDGERLRVDALLHRILGLLWGLTHRPRVAAGGE